MINLHPTYDLLQVTLHVADLQDNHQQLMVEIQNVLSMETRTPTGMADLVLTLPDKAIHGGELILEIPATRYCFLACLITLDRLYLKTVVLLDTHQKI